jgi:hypothetical protein
VHNERASSEAAAIRWEQAETAAAAADAPDGRRALAARAKAALAQDGAWGLITEIFGPFHTEDQARSNT